MKTVLKKDSVRWNLILIVLLLFILTIFGFINPKFWSVPRLLGSINDFMPVCIISLFVTFVLITGGMDIQAGSIVGLTSICLGLMWQELGMNIWAAAGISLFVGLICGCFSGFLVAYTGVPSMVVTLGGQFLYSGIAITITNLSATPSYKGISGFPGSFTSFVKGKYVVGIPNQVLVFMCLTAIAYILLHRTKYGRRIFLCGVNVHAAEYSGIRTKLTIMSTYMLSGMSASIAGILLTGYLGTAKADFGKEITLPIITAVVMGGTANTGGTGSVIGTALAAIIIVILRFGLSMAGLNTQYFDIPVGLLLILALAIRSATGRGIGDVSKLFRKRAKKI